MNDLTEANQNHIHGSYSPEPTHHGEGHNFIIPGPEDDYMSAEKPKRTNGTNTTLATLQNSGNRAHKFEEEHESIEQNHIAMSQGKFGDEHSQQMDDEEYRNLPLVNPLLYKPASKPPVIREGDWLCPDPTVSIFV
jgi:hypothetical protein